MQNRLFSRVSLRGHKAGVKGETSATGKARNKILPCLPPSRVSRASRPLRSPVLKATFSKVPFPRLNVSNKRPCSSLTPKTKAILNTFARLWYITRKVRTFFNLKALYLAVLMDFRYKCSSLKVENKNLKGCTLKTKCQQFEFKSVKGFEPRSRFVSRLIMIFRVNVVR